MTTTIDAIRAEYLRYKTMAEAAIAQLTDADLSASPWDSGPSTSLGTGPSTSLGTGPSTSLGTGPSTSLGVNNSIATICWHLSGNLESRFTDFLTSDGEKPWRHREEEFAPRAVSKAELLVKWQRGWDALMTALDQLTDGDLGRTITIRRQPLQINEALLRSLAHLTYHVGQIVFIAKSRRGTDWVSLSIPRGQSDRYNESPTSERASAHAHALQSRTDVKKR